MNVSVLRRPDDFFFLSSGATISNVVENSIVKQYSILGDNTDSPPYALLRNITYILSINDYSAFTDIIEPLEQS